MTDVTPSPAGDQPPTTPPPAIPPPPRSSTPPPPADDPDDPDLDTEGDEIPGDNRGRVNAIRRMQRERKELLQRQRTTERQLAEARGRLTQFDRLRQAVLEHAVVAAAAGMVTDPHDVVRLIDLSDVTVGDDGTIDSAKVHAKVEELVKNKPYLAAAAGGQPRPLPSGQRPATGGFNDMIRQMARGN